MSEYDHQGLVDRITHGIHQRLDSMVACRHPGSCNVCYGMAQLIRQDVAEIQRLTAGSASPVVHKIEFDNHHNALLCPYCNPDGLVLVKPSASPVVQEQEQTKKT